MANENSELKKQLLDAIDDGAITPGVLVNWFSKSMEPAAKTALSNEEVQDVNHNLVSEADYKKLESDVKDSLLKQKAKLQSDFNSILTQVNLKDPEEAQKMFPSDIRKQFTPELEKEWEKISKEQEKAMAEENKKDAALKKFLAQYLLICGVSKQDQQEIYKNLDYILQFMGLEGAELKEAKRFFDNGYSGIYYKDEENLLKSKKAEIEEAGASLIKSWLIGKEPDPTDLNKKIATQGQAINEFGGKISQNIAKLAQPATFLESLKEIDKLNKENAPLKKSNSDQSGTEQKAESVNESVDDKTIREVLEEAEDEEASIDFVTNYTDDYEMATWEFGTKLTEEGEEDWEDVLDYVVENLDKDEVLNWFAQVKIPEGEEIEMNRAERRLYKFLQSAAGNCSDEDYDRWFEA